MIIENIFEHAHKVPHKIAILYCGHAICYCDFVFWISRARHFLSEQNLLAGSVAILGMGTSLDNWVFGLASRSLGLTTVSVPSLEVLEEIAVRKIRYLITTARGFPKWTAPKNTNYEVIQVPDDFKSSRYEVSVLDPPRRTWSTGAHILLTSGTTGVRKKVLLNAACHLSNVQNRADVYGISEDSVVSVFGLAMWGAAGYNIPLSTWCLGGCVAFPDDLDPQACIRDGGLTHAIFTPVTLSKFLNVSAQRLRWNNALQVFVTGGPLPRTLANATKNYITPHIFTSVGSTEVGAWALTRIEHPEDLGSHRIHPSVEVQVVDEADRILPVGEMGAVRVRLLEGLGDYLDDEEASRIFFRQGYFYPGDLGTFQADGRLVLHGRTTNVINALGAKIAAEPIERALQDRLGAEGVCILSMQCEGTDEQLYVLIQSSHTISKADLATAIRAELSGFPRALVSLVENIPRNDMGKIDRAAVRKQIAAAHASRQA